MDENDFDDMARADGCDPCWVDSKDLDILTSGFLGRNWVLVCPYCGDVLDGGTFSLWDSAKERVKAKMSRLGQRARWLVERGL